MIKNRTVLLDDGTLTTIEQAVSRKVHALVRPCSCGESVDVQTDKYQSSWWVECWKCGESESSFNRDDAIAQWNSKMLIRKVKGSND